MQRFGKDIDIDIDVAVAGRKASSTMLSALVVDLLRSLRDRPACQASPSPRAARQGRFSRLRAGFPAPLQKIRN